MGRKQTAAIGVGVALLVLAGIAQAEDFVASPAATDERPLADQLARVLFKPRIEDMAKREPLARRELAQLRESYAALNPGREDYVAALYDQALRASIEDSARRYLELEARRLARTMNEEQLRQAIDFYSGETGQALVRAQAQPYVLDVSGTTVYASGLTFRERLALHLRRAGLRDR